MKKKAQRSLCISIILAVLFIVWTIAVSLIDVQAIGPNGSSVGFASLNGWFHELTGVHIRMYEIIDWLQIIAFAFVGGFGLLGLCQLIKRKSLFKVDLSILLLGGFYIIVLGVYAFFEMVVVNYRPTLIEGVLEASYPSSTTTLVICVMLTAIMQLRLRMPESGAFRVIRILMLVYTVLMVAGRLYTGVHWISDIVGGMLLSGALVMLHAFTLELTKNKKLR